MVRVGENCMVWKKDQSASSWDEPVDVSSHSEVSNLGHSFRSRTGEQTISGSDVSDNSHTHTLSNGVTSPINKPTHWSNIMMRTISIILI